MSTIAIIAALDRELAPLTRHWKTVRFSYTGRSFQSFEHENLVAIAGGIGCRAAGRAAKAVVAQYKPEMLISAGLAGALTANLNIAGLVTPNVIMDAATGAQYRCESGNGVLVTCNEIAGHASKQELARKFHAAAVDMEAAAVAEVAVQKGLAFACVKAISDELDFVMPPLSQFVDDEGQFQSGRFASWVALRPKYWIKTLVLARNSNRAARALCERLEQSASAGLKRPGIAKIEAAELSQTRP